jgi:mono/diheme cytochrome c family protein
MRVAIRQGLSAVIVVGLLGLLGFFLLSWRPAIAPIQGQTSNRFSPELVAKGEVLAAEGHCASCHTSPGGIPYAGGYGVKTPFGTIYGTSITPDPTTGIGLWSREAFTRAMREGVSRDGSHLFGAFPYWSFTKLSDDDIGALYAYMMTQPPVSATIPKNTVPFPLNIRALEEGWKILFFRDGRYRPDSFKSAEWNRGAYLSEALSDCSGCHTPRNALGGEKIRAAYSGALIDGWIAPALTKANRAPIPWTEEELVTYLRNGVTPLHGTTGATMTPVIRGALELPIVPDADIHAIAIYFTDLNHAQERASTIEATTRKALATSSLGSGPEYDPDAQLYAGACLGCHYNSETAPRAERPELALNSSLTASDPTNFIQAVLNGISNTQGAPGLTMPAYASSLNDSEISRLAAYLRRTRTKSPPWPDVEKKVAQIRRESVASAGQD